LRGRTRGWRSFETFRGYTGANGRERVSRARPIQRKPGYDPVERPHTPDKSGHPIFDDFQDARQVERKLKSAPQTWRSSLVVWEYALLRSERMGTGRPSRMELAALQRQAVESKMGFAIGFLAAGVVALAVLGLAAITAWRDSETQPALLFSGLWLFLAVVLSARYRRDFGRRGKAMRLVMAAANATPADRLSMLEEAVQLESDQTTGVSGS